MLFCSSNNFALQAKRKTLAASDVLSALSDMEFEEFTPELKSFLEGQYCNTPGIVRALHERMEQGKANAHIQSKTVNFNLKNVL